MSRARAAVVLAVAALAAMAPPPAGAQAAGDSAAVSRPLAATRTLVRRLAASGRAEVALRRESPDPLTGSAAPLAGRLALEPPDRVRLDFPESGERVTLRADGGEWLQPALAQMLRLEPGQVAPALGWWSLFLDAGGRRFTERRLGSGEYLVRPLDAHGAGDSVRVSLGADGLPARVRVRGPGLDADYRLTGWRFLAARGRGAFVLEAPPGVTVVELR